MSQEDGFGRCAVAAGTSRFLEIGFEGVGRIEVHDEANVGLVDAHAEGIGGDHHAGAVGLPRFLACVLVFGGQSRMIVERGDAGALEGEGGVACSAA